MQAAWAWTTGKAKAAAGATAAGTRKVAAMTCESSAAKAVKSKRKDLVGVAAGTAAEKASVVPTLNYFGWSAIGPVANSYAASFMAMYGGAVPAGAKMPLRCCRSRLSCSKQI